MRAWALLFLSSCAAETALLARLAAIEARMAEKDQQILKLQAQLDMAHSDKHPGRVLQQQASADITRIRVDAPNGKSQIVMGDVDAADSVIWEKAHANERAARRAPTLVVTSS